MAPILDRLLRCTGFDWDAGNARKNREAHGVTSSESEPVFLNRPLVAVPDHQHSRNEPRFHALGRTNPGRQLALLFTIRGELVRVISARDMSRRERRAYERSQKRKEEG